jgi:hypothetical protein
MELAARKKFDSEYRFYAPESWDSLRAESLEYFKDFPPTAAEAVYRVLLAYRVSLRSADKKCATFCLVLVVSHSSWLARKVV